MSKEISSKIKSFMTDNRVFSARRYLAVLEIFGDSDKERIYFPDFSEEGTFRLISPQYRKVTIQRLINEIEAFINEVLEILMEDKEKYGNQCESDNAFTRKARLLQSMYRVER